MADVASHVYFVLGAIFIDFLIVKQNMSMNSILEIYFFFILYWNGRIVIIFREREKMKRMNEISNVKENLLKLAHEWTVTENDGRIMKSWISIQNSFNSEQNVALFFIRFTENLFFSIPLLCKKKYWTRIIENT